VGQQDKSNGEGVGQQDKSNGEGVSSDADPDIFIRGSRFFFKKKKSDF
jgi:hypothetical protein